MKTAKQKEEPTQQNLDQDAPRPVPRSAPYICGWDPLSRLPHEALPAYANFRRWHRDFQDLPPTAAAKELGITDAELEQQSAANFWHVRAEAARLGAAFEFPGAPIGPGASILPPLPTEAPEFVRRREWAISLELAIASRQALHFWQQSSDPPTLTELVRLLDLSTRLARMAAGMGPEGEEVAQALQTQLTPDLKAAIDKAYPEPAAK